MPISFCAAVHGEFSQFLQVIFWVFISIVTLSVTAAVIMHYRKRNRFKNLDQEEIQQEVENLAEKFCYKTTDGKFIYLDHTGLLKELRKKLSYSNAKFAALQQDYKKLKYSLPF